MFKKNPAFIIVAIVNLPEPQTIAFGGVATGNIKAQLAARQTGTVKETGNIPKPTATAPKTSKKVEVVATLLVISVKNIINAAGLGAVDIAKSIVGINLKKIPNYYFNKGHYFYLKYSSEKIFNHLVYPVIAKSKTNNMGTILGIHVTIDTENQVKFGPDMEWIDEIDYTVDTSQLQRKKYEYV